MIDAVTLERPFGWVFFYQSRDFLLTGIERTRLAGNAPLIVNRYSGEVVSAGTAEPIEEHVASYEASIAQTPVGVAWG